MECVGIATHTYRSPPFTRLRIHSHVHCNSAPKPPESDWTKFEAGWAIWVPRVSNGNPRRSAYLLNSLREPIWRQRLQPQCLRWNISPSKLIRKDPLTPITRDKHPMTQ